MAGDEAAGNRFGSVVMEQTPPMFENGNVPPRRVANAVRRPREYLTPEEVERLIAAAQKRSGARTPQSVP